MKNRELKFRVWNGMEMIYDVTVGKFGAFYVNPMSKGNGLDENDSASLTPFNTRYSDETPVMQFTGLKDIHGKEIFEGDIVWWPHLSASKNEVYYNLEEATFYGRPISDADKTESYLGGKCEVIGNIYSNPELLTP